jgi:hypothetical protein
MRLVTSRLLGSLVEKEYRLFGRKLKTFKESVIE